MEEKKKKKFYTKRTVTDSLSKYSYFSYSDKDDFIEVSEWANGEGYDITIGNDKTISLNDGELKAINHLVNCLQYDFETDEKEYRLNRVCDDEL